MGRGVHPPALAFTVQKHLVFEVEQATVKYFTQGFLEVENKCNKVEDISKCLQP